MAADRPLRSTVGSMLLGALQLAGCGGQGDGAATSTDYLVPTALATTMAFDRVAPGYDAMCMLTPTGEAWCWGANGEGQLGAPTTAACRGGLMACSWQPVRAHAPMRFTSIGASVRHACALDGAGQAWCWGFGLGGQLGDGKRVSRASPAVVSGGHRFAQLDVGRTGLVSCGLDAAGGAWCWGPGDSGGMGDGTANSADVPVQVLATQPFTSIGAGANHACALDATGQAWCWGRNPYGTLGRGGSGASLMPAAVTGGHRFVALAVGGDFNCGLTAAGAAWCWGFGLSLGDGVLAHSDVPVPVAGGHLFRSLSAGFQHACGLTAEGAAWCWGVAFLTGGGSDLASKVPVAVAGEHAFRVLQAGGTATCAIDLNGTPWCWGLNNNGAVGQPNLGG